MNCAQAWPQIELLPLEVLERSEQTALEAHLVGCAACQATAQALEAAYAAQADEIERAVSAPLTGQARARALEAALRETGVEETSHMLVKKPVHPLEPVDAHRIEAVARRISLACSYCHAAATRAELVYCATCLGPHHEECFRTHGRCSLAGCQETETVRPTPRTPQPQRSRPLGKVLLLAAAVLVPGAIAAERWSVWSLQARTDQLQAQAWRRERDVRLAEEARRAEEERQRAATERAAPRVTLRFQERDLQAVIEDLARQAQVNVLLDPQAASERVSIQVSDVPWRDALEAVAGLARCEVEPRGEGLFVLRQPPRVTLQGAYSSVRTAFQQLAAAAGRNLVLGPDVQGPSTLDLKEARWDAALMAVAHEAGAPVWTVSPDLLFVGRTPPPGAVAFQLGQSPDPLPPAAGPAVSLSLDGAPLEQACQELARAAGRIVELQGLAAGDERRVSLQVRAVAWESVLRLIAERADCDLELSGARAVLRPIVRLERVSAEGARLGDLARLLAELERLQGRSVMLVVANEVSGRQVSLDLLDVRPQEALRGAAAVAGCELQAEGGVSRIGPVQGAQPAPDRSPGQPRLDALALIDSGQGLALIGGRVLRPLDPLLDDAGQSLGRVLAVLAEGVQLSLLDGSAQLLSLGQGLDRVRRTEPPTARPGAYLGLAAREAGGQLFVDDVMPGSPAAVAGVQRDDRLVALRLPQLDRPEPLSVPLARLEDLTGALRGLLPELRITLVLERAGEELRLECELGERPR